MEHHFLGIRHHGPGSARSLIQSLEALEPDVLLVEGPPDAEALLPLAAHEEMVPPVALLIYVPDSPRRAVYYPFAEFSPEWQAIRYGLTHKIPIRFMDLPQSNRFALEPEDDGRPVTHDRNGGQNEQEHSTGEMTVPEPTPDTQYPIPDDPFQWIAKATGFSDSERWWEQMVEQRSDSQDLFAAILELMSALRQEFPLLPTTQRPNTRTRTTTRTIGPNDLDPEMEARREAWMRQTIRTAARDRYEKIAVVCGAWHGPALVDLGAAKPDVELLKGMPRVKTAATWIPWTYDRLGWWSGYGAGITSPGYYDTLWHHPHRVSVRWMSRVTKLFRDEDIDASPASSIEAVRLADTLAALRDRSLPGLQELMEASQATLCFGADSPMRLIQRKLVVGERMGTVPADAPTVPLQQDLEREQRRLRLQPEAAERVLDLDLRKPNELDRSRLLHRLNLLDVTWGVDEQVGGKSGTFHEFWRLRWEPEMAVGVIEAAIWGNTVLTAATNRACDLAQKATELAALTALVAQSLLADLPDAIGTLLRRLEDLAGTTSDVPVLMDAIPPLVNAARYGNVRGVNTAVVEHVIDGLIARACVGLPAACSALNDDAAGPMFERIVRMNQAIAILDKEDHRTAWRSVLARLADQNGIHGLVGGRCCRLLVEDSVWTMEEVARRVGLALSRANPPSQAGAWVEGFLRGSGLLLLHREELWNLLDAWVDEMRPEDFLELLPIVRRTFATFAPPERRQMGERAARGRQFASHTEVEDDIDPVRAALVLPTVARLLGLAYGEEVAG